VTETRVGLTSRWRVIFEVVTTLIMVAAAIAVLVHIFRGRQEVGNQAAAPRLPSSPVSLAGAPRLGNLSAPVVLIEYADFECAFCAKFARETWPSVKREYVETGRVQVAFSHVPLAKHTMAQKAAEAAACANRQGSFWRMYDQLFLPGALLDFDSLRAHGTAIGLDEKAYFSCLEGGSREEVEQDLKVAAELQVTGTPAFFVGSLGPGGYVTVQSRIAGARPFKDFKSAFDAVVRP